MTRKVALVTGGSRGVGAATVLALVNRGYDVAFTFLSRARRAEAVVEQARRTGRRVVAYASDMTDPAAVQELVAAVGGWSPRIDVLVLNASGGLERDRLLQDSGYPMRINRDAQTEVASALGKLLSPGATVVFVTSHWAHLYGRTEQLAAYEPVAASKFAGEQALRAMYARPGAGARLLVVTGDIVEGTVTPKLLERAERGLVDRRRSRLGAMPTTEDMAEAIAAAADDPDLPSGHTVVVGGELRDLAG